MSIETVAVRMGFAPDQALAIEQTCHRFKIDTPMRASHFLAQVAHESGTGKWMREIWGPTTAQRGYEGRIDLGNVLAGDGKRYMGRGLIQLTGRANYTAYSRAIHGDERAVTTPDMVEKMPDAALAAGWFWARKGLNDLADRDDLRAVTRRVNGGYNGLADRQTKLIKAKGLFAQLVSR